MILVDSFGWIEFFTDGSLADKYFKYLKDQNKVVTPTIVLYEVYKKIRRERSEEEALVAAAQINKTNIMPLDETIALSAAEISLRNSLPMADAIVYATAESKGVKIATSDPHFENLENVVFVR